MAVSIQQIKETVTQLARKIDAPIEFLPAIGTTPYDAQPHIEICNGELHYVVVERGKERSREKTTKLDDLLYLIFDSITFNMACRHLIRQSVNDDDSRMVLFSKQEELMGTLSEEWKIRVQEEHIEILRIHP